MERRRSSSLPPKSLSKKRKRKVRDDEDLKESEGVGKTYRLVTREEIEQAKKRRLEQRKEEVRASALLKPRTLSQPSSPERESSPRPLSPLRRKQQSRSSFVQPKWLNSASLSLHGILPPADPGLTGEALSPPRFYPARFFVVEKRLFWFPDPFNLRRISCLDVGMSLSRL